MDKKRIKALRERLDETQAEFAKRLGVDRSTVWRWEMGKRDPDKFVVRELERIERRVS